MVRGNDNTNRRTVLQGVGSAIVGGSVASATVSASENVETVRLPRLSKSADEALEYHEVPRDWWNHIQAAKQALENLKPRIADTQGVYGAGLKKSDEPVEAFGGLNGREIVVRVDMHDSPDLSFVQEQNGFDITTEEVPKPELGGSCHNLWPVDDVPGGQAVSADLNGTAGFAALYQQIDKYGLVTCQHLWQGFCDESNLYDNLYVGHTSNREDFGTVAAEDNILDAVFVEENASKDVDPFIKKAPSDTVPVTGFLTESGVEMANENVRRCHKVGAATGHRTGYINYTHEESWQGFCGSCVDQSCPTWNNDGVSYDMDGTEGDSGGPIYVENDNGEAEIVSLFTEYYPCTNLACEEDCSGTNIGTTVGGPSVYSIVDRLNVAVLVT